MFGSFLIPGLVVFTILVLFAGMVLWAKNFVKVPPDKVAIITGRKRKMADGKVVGYRIVRGGSTFVWPIREQVQYLPLGLMTFAVEVQKAYNKNGVAVFIEAIANVKIKGEDQAIANAVERFLEKPSQVQVTVKETLEGHLRSIVGTMTIEELNSDRKAFAQRVTEESVVDLEKMGIGADSVVIKKITDEHGYLDALGIQRTAEVKRDAEVGKAQAEADAKKKTSEATRDAEQISTANDAQVADAKRDLAVKKAQYDAEVAKEQATAGQAGPLASAHARKAVVAAEVEVEKSRVTAEIDLQTAVKDKTKAELEATLLVRANAEKERVVTEAQGKALARTTQAEAERTALEAEGDGQAKKTRLAGLAAAEVEEAKGKAEAAAERAKLLATAEGTKAQLLAHAEGTQAELLAQAKGMKELVAAYADMTPEQQRLVVMKLVLERMPEITQALGEAGEKVMGQIAQAVVASLGQIDNLTVYDSSGGNVNGHDGALRRVMKVGPDAIFDTLTQLKATGVLPALAGVAKNLGLDLSGFLPPAENGNGAVATLSETVDPEEIRTTSRSRTRNESDASPTVSV